MKTTYYLLEHEGKLSIYMVAEVETPPMMDMGVLDTWVQNKHGQTILPYGCSDIKVMIGGFLHPYSVKSVRVIDTYEISDIPKPHWLEEFRDKVGEQVDRVLLIGNPTVYTHLVPIKPFSEDAEYLGMEIEPFVSVDPVAEVEIAKWKEEVEATKGKKKDSERVLVTGCFDLFHAGHVHFLTATYMQYVGHHRELHVGIPDDTSYGYLKGRSPIYPFAQRKAILEAIQYVDEVHEFKIWDNPPYGAYYPQNGHADLFDKVKPVLFVDSRQKPREDIGAMPYLNERNIPIVYVDSIDIHTTDIIKRIKE